MPDDNIIDSAEVIDHVMTMARDCAFSPERVDLRPCLSRRETKSFMRRFGIRGSEIREILSRLRLEDYSYTSRISGEADAYVFGPEVERDLKVFLKFQIVNDVLVISFHEPERAMNYPYRR